MVAHKPVSGLAVGASGLKIAFFVPPPTVAAVDDVGQVFEAGMVACPARLRLCSGKQRQHHRRAEKNRALVHGLILGTRAFSGQ